ncbi:amidohydrolase family protein [Pleionea litopenaei]|uniref:Amidohydrolase family protein n=1 Tax=Pleionea litopenaei TaxID=3070815 RepID=A0AA51X8N8_9GAMM|nr:amidohydrolase family protein [Pleionea sp. HL-JVS1]WMS88285.1 amidohydrolase family protein [Pleionea sp. HL-JVS1]
MKQTALTAALIMAMTYLPSSHSHTPLNEVPDLSQYTESVQDWEDHRAFFEGQSLDVLDIHLHPGSYDKLGPKGKEFVKSVFPVNLPDVLKVPILRLFSSFQLNPYGAFIGIKNECRKASANNCILFATYAPETWGIEPNEDLIGYLDDSRNQFNNQTFFYGLASLSVENWSTNKENSLNQLRNALSHPKIVGIKLAFAHTLTAFDDRQYFDIYEVAKSFNKPVYHHVGTSPLRKVSEFEEEEREYVFRTFDPMYLETAIKEFPDVNFIMGHAGNDANVEGFDKVDEVFFLAEKYPNVFIEVSALGSSRSDPDGSKMERILMQAKSLNIIHKLIYGSDGPGSPGNIQGYKERVIESLQRANYTFEQAQMVMASNARSLFSIPAANTIVESNVQKPE